ncbi:MAG: AraC family transcriptional regulator [Oliverpabstia sp.]|nr:AraC family transcriptional regulator [Lachnospiraceae bacterium]MDY5026783.1 AraC family transcriptional regulator [Oliverpabstia sp.]
MNPQKAIKDFTIHGTSEIPLHIYQQYDPFGTISIPYHWHDEWEWIYVEKGFLILTVDGEQTIAKEGDFFFINSQELHRLEAYDNIPSIHHALVFSPEILPFSYEDLCESRYIRPLLNHQNIFLRHTDLSDPAHKELAKLFLRLLESYRKKEPGWYLEIKAYIYQMIFLCIRHNLLISSNPSFSSTDQKKIKIKKAISFIHKNYALQITLNDLAQCLNMNPQYFCRFFKNAAGKTPMEYLKEYRLRQAKRLLLETGDSILEICMQVGFESPSYFIQQFRFLYGMTPGEYRKQERTGDSSVSLSGFKKKTSCNSQ